MEYTYEGTADELTSRILKLIPKNPTILSMENVYDLCKIKGFKCDDLNPSLFQVSFSLNKACKLYSKTKAK